MRIKLFVQRHPLIAYFGLTFAIAWVGSLSIGGVTRVLQGEAISFGQVMLILVFMLISPSLAGVLVTAIASGRAGLRDLWARMTHGRVAIRWVAVAVLTTPVLLLGILFALALIVSPVYQPGLNLLFGVSAGLLAGFFEEIGWSGFATPRLLENHSPLMSGLLLGVPWGIWHMMAGFMSSVPGQEGFWFTEFLLFWVVTVTAYRVLMTWVYSKTESVLVAQIMHAFFSGTLAATLPALSQGQTLLYETIFAICMWGLVVIVVIADRKTPNQRNLFYTFSLMKGG